MELSPFPFGKQFKFCQDDQRLKFCLAPESQPILSFMLCRCNKDISKSAQNSTFSWRTFVTVLMTWEVWDILWRDDYHYSLITTHCKYTTNTIQIQSNTNPLPGWLSLPACESQEVVNLRLSLSLDPDRQYQKPDSWDLFWKSAFLCRRRFQF